MELNSEELPGYSAPHRSLCTVHVLRLLLIGDQHHRQQHIGRFDSPSHLLGFLVRRCILVGVVGEIGITSRVPVIELDMLGPFQIFGCDRKRQSKYLQRMGDFLMNGLVGHV